MKIIIARTAGFCMGVRRAVDLVLDASNSAQDSICTYGPLIHNPQVLEMLTEKGIPSITDIPEKAKGTILIRAHGVPPQDQEALKKAGFTVINATCPRVIRVQTIIKKHAKKGFAAIIIGDRDHPEVKGLLGYAANNGHTASSMEALSELPEFSKAVVVAQTTQDTSFYDEVKAWVKQKHPHYKLFDTICDSTEKRQAEARKIAGESDLVVVVGGKESGNTRRLAQIAKETGKSAIHIEDAADLDLELIASADTVAITAGASTPNWIINKTHRVLEDSLQRKHRFYSDFLMQSRNFLLKTNLLLSAGAGCLTYACSVLQGMEQSLNHAAVAMLYILSMQIINNLFSVKSDHYNNPGRAAFYKQNQGLLASLAVISGGAGLYLAFSNNIISFIILAIMSLLGLSYNQRILPAFSQKKRAKRLKDLPGSKTILIAAAWGTVTALLPAISFYGGISFLPGFLFVTGLVFSRTAFFDILEMQGDRITGKETLPILLGEKKSIKLIKLVLTALAILLVLSSASGITAKAGFFMALLPLCMLYFINASTKKGTILPGNRLDFIVESHFIIAGGIAAFF